LRLMLDWFGDEERAALYHHQLGLVAERNGELEEAKRNYSKAIELFERAGDHYSQAMAHRSLNKLRRELDRGCSGEA